MHDAVEKNVAIGTENGTGNRGSERNFRPHP